MLTTIGNIHRSKLPGIGAIGYITNGTNRFGEKLFYRGEKQTWQVVSFPLCDNVSPYSRGIHTANFKNLRTGEVKRFSGFYFEEK